MSDKEPSRFAIMRAEFKEGGLRGLFRRYGWKLFAAFFLFYLIRDLTLYVLIPYLIFRGACAGPPA